MGRADALTTSSPHPEQQPWRQQWVTTGVGRVYMLDDACFHEVTVYTPRAQRWRRRMQRERLLRTADSTRDTTALPNPCCMAAPVVEFAGAPATHPVRGPGGLRRQREHGKQASAVPATRVVRDSACSARVDTYAYMQRSALKEHAWRTQLKVRHANAVKRNAGANEMRMRK